MESEAAYTTRLLWFEVRNALLIGERKRRLDAPRATLFLARLSRLAIITDDSPIEPELMALARKHRLTIYDAAYLELACRRRLKLASLDRDLLKAAAAEGVALVHA